MEKAQIKSVLQNCKPPILNKAKIKELALFAG
jgi:hypothetical protein